MVEVKGQETSNVDGPGQEKSEQWATETKSNQAVNSTTAQILPKHEVTGFMFEFLLTENESTDAVWILVGYSLVEVVDGTKSYHRAGTRPEPSNQLP